MSDTMLPSHFFVACHTDNVGPGSTFVAIQGMNTDGIQFIPEAIRKGATCIVIEHDVIVPPTIEHLMQEHSVTVKRVPSARLALAHLSAQALGNPAKKLRIIGITGTKGKTTTTFLLEHILRVAGHKTALISTVKNSINGRDLQAPLTTPQPDYLHHFFAACVKEQVEVVVMEVAAQALSLHRTAGIIFDGALFTNFSLEHLEFYPDMESYFAAKQALFDQCAPQAPLLINADDLHGQKLLARYAHALSFSIYEQASIRASFVDRSTAMDGIHINITHGTALFEVRCPHLFGEFNAYNMLAAISMALHLKIEPAVINQALITFTGVPGRLQKHILPNGATCIIDYAHNPASYQAVLSLLKSNTRQLIVVFGAAGRRDASKRPLMGAVAALYADILMITSDNPRGEDPVRIMDDIIQGVPENVRDRVRCEVDREQAIRKAYSLSQSDSIIAILGKGTDEYQIFHTDKIPFSETRIVQSLYTTSEI
jgi:UDP-N-acetylmuramoyl-L-alanyl-D-glutamate--2,6-diaminopimelate ligase